MKINFKIVAAFLTTLLLLLLVAVLGSDYIEYRKNYKDFKEYMAQKESREDVPDFEPIDIPDMELGEQETPEQSTEAPVEPSAPEEGEILATAKPIVDVSGNVLWQPENVTAEDADKIRGLVAQRKQIYSWENSYEKTMAIYDIDKQILDIAQCTFTNITVNFVGDSVTEGVGGKDNGYGSKTGYVDYVNQYLQFETVYNNGKGGRMIGDYNKHPELSIDYNSSQLLLNSVNITVLYAGINDFLTTEESKNYGVIDNGTTGGYCGQLQRLFHNMQNNYPGMDVFIVTCYQNDFEDTTENFVNFNGKPVLKDYMDPQIRLANECGFHVIDLFNTGFFDISNQETKDALLSDSIHPNDTGYQILGTHIACEMLLYYLGME